MSHWNAAKWRQISCVCISRAEANSVNKISECQKHLHWQNWNLSRAIYYRADGWCYNVDHILWISLKILWVMRLCNFWFVGDGAIVHTIQLWLQPVIVWINIFITVWRNNCCVDYLLLYYCTTLPPCIQWDEIAIWKLKSIKICSLSSIYLNCLCNCKIN